ncbi:MAG: riboflavin synthase, partial [Oscillospiraceae bacterium]|nr:riboflavin synthase [Oscillospiraceae bacterium]
IWYTVSAAPELMRYIVDKGSVALDGISLTVAKVTDDSYSVSVIPHTAKMTVLGEKKAGDRVNIENDIIAKYVEKLMLPKIEKTPKKSGITMEFLMENGF